MPNSKLVYKDDNEEQAKEYADNVNACTWQEFRDTGLLWWINMLLHTFGWAIVVDRISETGEIVEVYPARVKFRGFDEKSNTEGYIKVAKYVDVNSAILLKEARDE